MKTSISMIAFIFASLFLSQSLVAGGGGPSCKNKYFCKEGSCRKSCGNTNSYCSQTMNNYYGTVPCKKDSDCAKYVCKPCADKPDSQCPNI
jgi:hypothetical protein